MKVNNHPPPRTHKNTHRHTHSDANRAGGCVTVALEGKVFFMFRVVDVVDLCAGVSACACACVRACMRVHTLCVCVRACVCLSACLSLSLTLSRSLAHALFLSPPLILSLSFSLSHSLSLIFSLSLARSLARSLSLTLSFSLSLSQTWTRPSIDPIAYPRLSLKSEIVRIYPCTYVCGCVWVCDVDDVCVYDVHDPADSSQVRFITTPHSHSHRDARTLEIKGGDLPPPDIQPMRISVGYEKIQGSQKTKSVCG